MSDSISDQLLTRPPRLLPDGTGYDWKEVDRFFQRLYLLLGQPSGNSYNVISSASTADVESGADFALDHQHEIKVLEQMYANLENQIQMITNDQQAIRDLMQQVQNTQTDHFMGV